MLKGNQNTCVGGAIAERRDTEFRAINGVRAPSNGSNVMNSDVWLVGGLKAWAPRSFLNVDSESDFAEVGPVAQLG